VFELPELTSVLDYIVAASVPELYPHLTVPVAVRIAKKEVVEALVVPIEFQPLQATPVVLVT
jgi:hypothetical protein